MRKSDNIASPVLCFPGEKAVSHLLNVCVCNDDLAMFLRWEGLLTWATHDKVRQPLGDAHTHIE